ncbi:hypothetical protein HPB47_011456 [Ixodes persulcatus]|uniref:Uncharacterized protein n=1 Tax=Ixodes persulcatus TaxID=34615 RepID=A0AC60NX38_IXOPE|nr:hypothetical protein HPB47_011456 [Ixodes persulcatus]
MFGAYLTVQRHGSFVPALALISGDVYGVWTERQASGADVMRMKLRPVHTLATGMTEASFDELLGLVHDRLLHAPTHRSPIAPAERLAITLRFLASPGSLGHVAISYRTHKATLSGILQETLPDIWDCLSPSLGGNSSPAAISIRDLLADHFISPRAAIPWQHDIVTRE